MTISEKNDTIVDLSNFSTYNKMSYGYDWMTYEDELLINSLLRDNTLNDVVNSPIVWDKIGNQLFRMPYILIDGEYVFVFPELSGNVEADLIKKDKIGSIIKALTADDEYIFLNNDSKFILYNNKIEAAGEDILSDGNIVNIVFNTITLFLLYTFKKGVGNG